MDNIDILLVRACKSKNPVVRLRSVYRRFYLRAEIEEQYTNSMLMILSKIVDSSDIRITCIVMANYLLNRRDPLAVIIDIIRFASVEKFDSKISRLQK